jgi:hypothetical protein
MNGRTKVSFIFTNCTQSMGNVNKHSFRVHVSSLANQFVYTLSSKCFRYETIMQIYCYNKSKIIKKTKNMWLRITSINAKVISTKIYRNDSYPLDWLVCFSSRKRDFQLKQLIPGNNNNGKNCLSFGNTMNWVLPKPRKIPYWCMSS